MMELPRAVAALLVFVLATTMLTPTPLQAGKLDAVRGEVRGDDDEGEKRRESKGRSTSDDDDDDDDSFGDELEDELGLFVLEMMWYVVTLPWRAPYWALESETERAFRYDDYPYAASEGGVLLLAPDEETASGGLTGGNTQETALRLSVDGYYQWDRLTRLTVAARLQTPLRVELDTTWAAYAERLPRNSSDGLIIGTAHVAYRFAHDRDVQFRTGVGYRQMSDRLGSEYGFDLVYGFDLFPAKPLVASFDAHVGSLGKAGVAELRFTLGMTLDSAELLLGYEHLWIGKVEMGGLLLGTRVWF